MRTELTVNGRLLTLAVAFTAAVALRIASALAPAPVSAATNVTGAGAGAGVGGISCPEACACSVVASKNVTICQERGLSSIPAGIAKRTHFLDVSGNRIEALRDREFWSLGLVSLETIVADSSGVAEVHKGAFAGLRWLRELDLSNNRIAGLDPLVFADNKLLEMVNLSGNPIRTLVSFQFTALPLLKQLDLRNCALRLVQPEAFSNLLFLETLSLRNNSLATLPKDLFTWLRYLKQLDLRQNPWRCDCDVQSLLILLSIRRLYTRDLSCTYQVAVDSADVDADNETETRTRTRTETSLWQHMQNVDLDCIPGIENSVKENLLGLSERLRQTASTPATKVAVAATAAGLRTRLFSSQSVVETSLLPIALAAVAATVFFLCVVGVYTKCRRLVRGSTSSSSSSSCSNSKVRGRGRGRGRGGGGDCCFGFCPPFAPWRSKKHSAAAAGDDDDDNYDYEDDFERTCYSNFDEDCSDISLTVEL